MSRSQVTTHALGAVQAVFGVLAVAGGATFGAATCLATFGLGCAGGALIAAHGVDNVVAGIITGVTGEAVDTATKRAATQGGQPLRLSRQR